MAVQPILCKTWAGVGFSKSMAHLSVCRVPRL